MANQLSPLTAKFQKLSISQEISFPYVPYPVQIEYMDAVTKSCENRQNALLESPTGTGKTLALLCATLSWIRGKRETSVEKKNIPRRVFYMSRTHSQLSQVVKELKKTEFTPLLVPMGSREHLCIHPAISKQKGSQLNIACKLLINQNQCPYYSSLKKCAFVAELKSHLLDIEDLRRFGEAKKQCPYYGAKWVMNDADLILMPYNYFLDPKICTQMKDVVENSILIFDEAHNVTKVIEDATSFFITLPLLAKCLGDIKNIEKLKDLPAYQKILCRVSPEKLERITEADIEFVKKPIANFIKFLKDQVNLDEQGVEYEGYELPALIHHATSNKPEESKATDYSIKLVNYALYAGMLENFIEVLTEANLGEGCLGQFYDILEIAYIQIGNCPSDISDYKVVLYNDVPNKLPTSQAPKNQKIHVFNLNPGIGFAKLLAKFPHNIILTSGTLSPLDSLAQELQSPFPIKLETAHVIEKSQVLVQIVSRSDSPFNFKYSNRKDIKQMLALGEFIKDVCNVTPGGILVFFSSYAVMEDYYSSWGKYIEQIKTIKRVFKEEKGTEKNDQMLKAYKEHIASNKGAVLLAVLRGKVSEGLDFADDEARTVMVVGIPFSPIMDKKIKYKKSYLDAKAEKYLLTGTKWYIQDAIKAVNQAIGRLIRHKKDYGAILLVDERYEDSKNYEVLSKWLKEAGIKLGTTSDAVKRLAEFFAVQRKDEIKEEKKVVKVNVEVKEKVKNYLGSEDFELVNFFITRNKLEKDWGYVAEQVFFTFIRKIKREEQNKEIVEMMESTKWFIGDSLQREIYGKELDELIKNNLNLQQPVMNTVCIMAMNNKQN
eukprot:TRINITY_DN2443_c0_g1_i2.p2 TRINITY_DN2443_c0_g1~~TRINITY_DN2443_c0_g1_i2.p2  ORF type:complete len:830 (-),score=117.10 TRINITY_DN2443_c0_g1_i2:1658-4147(-)